MKYETVKKESFFAILQILSRISPFVITEANNSYKLSLFDEIIPLLDPHIIIEDIPKPGELFELIKQHRNELLIFKDDIFQKRKNYREIIEGAVCSSPDSMSPWTIFYGNKKEFIFKGKIILFTLKTKDEIKNDKRFSYFSRDCLFI